VTTENDEQKEFWEAFADKWVHQQGAQDALLAPVLAEVLSHAALKPGERVLDIGCGTGTSTLSASQAVGAEGHVLGVDISRPMLARAREIAGAEGNVAFETADAAHYPFARAPFDAAISRFGVMFFVQPVAAFLNIRKGLKPGGRLCMACWSHLDKNPWFQVPMYAAKAQLGAPPPLDPDAPGPLAFRDIPRVCGILSQAGFTDCKGQEVQLHLTPDGDLAQVARQASHIGPASRTLDYFEGTEADFDAIAARVADGFASYQSAHGVRVPAAINIFTAAVA